MTPLLSQLRSLLARAPVLDRPVIEAAIAEIESPPARPPMTELESLLDHYWNTAYAEGREGVSYGDTANKILCALRDLYAPPARTPMSKAQNLELGAALEDVRVSAKVASDALDRAERAEADLAAARALLQRLIDANPRYAADERLQLDLEAALKDAK